MYNITILSLSLTSIYSDSPLFVGNKNIFQRLSLNNYIFSTIILNPKALSLDKSIFLKGVSAIIYANSIKNLNEITPLSLIAEIFDTSNFTIFEPANSQSFVTIQDCFFSKVQCQSDYLVKLGNAITFYMTSCIFDSCYSKKTALSLCSKATTLSHICCSKVTSGDINEPIFITTDIPGQTFFKFYYSTLVGTSDKVDAKRLTYFFGKYSMRFQCVNTSFYSISGEFISDFTAQNCLTLLMNTFYHCDSTKTLRFNIQNGYQDRYNHYCGLSNFIDNKHSGHIIYFDMNDNTNIIIDQCVFSNDDSNGKQIFDGGGNKVKITNCVFSSNLDSGSLSSFDTNSCTFVSDPSPHTLAHFTFGDLCNGVNVVDAHGCQNDTCPDANQGCETFGFGDGAVVYDEKFHPDINTPTPTPTQYFTFSSVFSSSLVFTLTNLFSDSKVFSDSKFFTETNSFFIKESEFSNDLDDNSFLAENEKSSQTKSSFDDYTSTLRTKETITDDDSNFFIYTQSFSYSEFFLNDSTVTSKSKGMKLKYILMISSIILCVIIIVVFSVMSFLKKKRLRVINSDHNEEGELKELNNDKNEPTNDNNNNNQKGMKNQIVSENDNKETDPFVIK